MFVTGPRIRMTMNRSVGNQRDDDTTTTGSGTATTVSSSSRSNGLHSTKASKRNQVGLEKPKTMKPQESSKATKSKSKAGTTTNPKKASTSTKQSLSKLLLNNNYNKSSSNKSSSNNNNDNDDNHNNHQNNNNNTNNVMMSPLEDSYSSIVTPVSRNRYEDASCATTAPLSPCSGATFATPNSLKLLESKTHKPSRLEDFCKRQNKQSKLHQNIIPPPLTTTTATTTNNAPVSTNESNTDELDRIKVQEGMTTQQKQQNQQRQSVHSSLKINGHDSWFDEVHSFLLKPIRECPSNSNRNDHSLLSKQEGSPSSSSCSPDTKHSSEPLDKSESNKEYSKDTKQERQKQTVQNLSPQIDEEVDVVVGVGSTKKHKKTIKKETATSSKISPNDHLDGDAAAAAGTSSKTKKPTKPKRGKSKSKRTKQDQEDTTRIASSEPPAVTPTSTDENQATATRNTLPTKTTTATQDPLLETTESFQDFMVMLNAPTFSEDQDGAAPQHQLAPGTSHSTCTAKATNQSIVSTISKEQQPRNRPCLPKTTRRPYSMSLGCPPPPLDNSFHNSMKIVSMVEAETDELFSAVHRRSSFRIARSAGTQGRPLESVDAIANAIATSTSTRTIPKERSEKRNRRQRGRSVPSSKATSKEAESTEAKPLTKRRQRTRSSILKSIEPPSPSKDRKKRSASRTRRKRCRSLPSDIKGLEEAAAEVTASSSSSSTVIKPPRRKHRSKSLKRKTETVKPSPLYAETVTTNDTATSTAGIKKRTSKSKKTSLHDSCPASLELTVDNSQSLLSTTNKKSLATTLAKEEKQETQPTDCGGKATTSTTSNTTPKPSGTNKEMKEAAKRSKKRSSKHSSKQKSSTSSEPEPIKSSFEEISSTKRGHDHSSNQDPSTRAPPKTLTDPKKCKEKSCTSAADTSKRSSLSRHQMKQDSTQRNIIKEEQEVAETPLSSNRLPEQNAKQEEQPESAKAKTSRAQRDCKDKNVANLQGPQGKKNMSLTQVTSSINPSLLYASEQATPSSTPSSPRATSSSESFDDMFFELNSTFSTTSLAVDGQEGAPQRPPSRSSTKSLIEVRRKRLSKEESLKFDKIAENVQRKGRETPLQHDSAEQRKPKDHNNKVGKGSENKRRGNSKSRQSRKSRKEKESSQTRRAKKRDPQDDSQRVVKADMDAKCGKTELENEFIERNSASEPNVFASLHESDPSNTTHSKRRHSFLGGQGYCKIETDEKASKEMVKDYQTLSPRNFFTSTRTKDLKGSLHLPRKRYSVFDEDQNEKRTLQSQSLHQTATKRLQCLL